jgi:multimeric flavodoxin WrbA
MKSMNIVGIISSSNLNGNSATLLREALKGAQDSGATVSEIFLPQFDINFCKGCLVCMRTGSCVQKDDFDSIRNMISNADGIILSSPTYAAAPNAIMKNFVDRLGLFEYMTSSILGGKYIATISTAKSFGADKTVKYLASVPLGSIFKKAFISGTLGVILRGGKKANEFPEYMRKASLLGERLVKDYESGNTHPFQNFFPRLFSDIIMKPLIRKGISEYKDTDMKGVYDNLKERKMIE